MITEKQGLESWWTTDVIAVNPEVGFVNLFMFWSTESSTSSVQPEVGPVVGGYPAWATGFTGPHAHLIVSVPRGVMPTRYGWGNKILWAVKNSYTGQVNIRGNNLADNSPLWFENIQDGNAPTTTLLTIDASHPNTSASGFTDYGARMYIAHSGCYQLMVTWDGGDWRIIFAAELVDAFPATISPTL